MTSIKQIQLKMGKLSDELDIMVTDLEEKFDGHTEKWQDSEAGDIAREKIDILTEWRDFLSDAADNDDV